MIYFEMIDTPVLVCAPRLVGWSQAFDVRNIRIDRFPKIPKMQLFTIEPTEDTVFTDVILFPFLLVSPVVKDVIKMYRERCFFRQVILLDQINNESRLYYLSVLDETGDIRICRKEYLKESEVDEAANQGKALRLNKHLFWVRDLHKRHIILSMEMAESLLQRGVTGLGLCEVELFARD